MDLQKTIASELMRVGKDGWPTVQEATGVSEHTLLKIAKGITKESKYTTLLKLSAYFNVRVAQ